MSNTKAKARIVEKHLERKADEAAQVKAANSGRRQRVKRLDSSELQGDGSYVLIRRASVDEAQALRDLSDPLQLPDVEGLETREAQRLIREAQEENEHRAREILASFVIEWNWVDDYDEPLVLPSVDLSVLGKLTQEELSFIYAGVNGIDQEAQKKKKP